MTAKFDPMTGEPIAEPKVKFDPMTGEPIAEPKVKFDPMTGEPIAEPKVKFDPMTGEPIDSEPSVRFDPMTGRPINSSGANTNAPKSSKKPIYICGAACVAVAAVAVFAVYSVMASGVFAKPSTKILTAFKNTVDNKPELIEVLDIGDILESNELGLSVDIKDGRDSYSFELNSDKKEKQLAITTDDGDSAVASLTDDQLKIEVLDSLFVYNYNEPLEGVFGENADEDDIEAVNQALTSISSSLKNNDFNEAAKKAFIKEFKNLEFEKVSAEKFKINGKNVSCKGYEYTFTDNDYYSFIDSMEEALGEYINSDEYWDMLSNRAGYMDEATLTFFLHKNKIAAIRMTPEGEYSSSATIVFRNSKTPLADIAVLDEDDDEVFAIEEEKDGNNVTYSVYDYGEYSFGIEYNTKTGLIEVDDEFECYLNRSKNEITFSYEDSYYDAELAITLSGKADMKKLQGDEINISDLTESDLDYYEDEGEALYNAVECLEDLFY